jgi:putative transposase
MPNHVHLVVNVWQTPLSRLLGRWKGRSAHDANLLLHRRGPLWQIEYFDTLIRDEAHLACAIRYTEHNPLKANLVRECRGWLWGSARWRDVYGRLVPQPMQPSAVASEHGLQAAEAGEGGGSG